MPESLASSSLYQRIHVVGVTGSGKTTLARELAARLHAPHIELDALHWGPEWTPAPDDTFRQRLREVLAGDCWVVDGNYSKMRDIVWARADTVIWLDYPFVLVFWRLIRRTWRRVFLQQSLWNENREGWRQVFSRDSIFLWRLRSFGKKRRHYLALIQQPENAHLAFIHLTSPQQTTTWLQSTFPSEEWPGALIQT